MADLTTEAQQLAIRAGKECRALRTLINGNELDLSSLNTEVKSNLVAAINELAGRSSVSSWNDLTDKPVEFPPAAHTHTQLHDPVTVSGNGIALTGQQISLSIGTGANQVAAGNHTHPFGTTAGTFCQGNDARLSDARTPIAHGHTEDEIAGAEKSFVEDKLMRWGASHEVLFSLADAMDYDTLVFPPNSLVSEAFGGYTAEMVWGGTTWSLVWNGLSCECTDSGQTSASNPFTLPWAYWSNSGGLDIGAITSIPYIEGTATTAQGELANTAIQPTDPIIPNPKTFSGQIELTGQTAPNATSAMTRELVEASIASKIVRHYLYQTDTQTQNSTSYKNSDYLTKSLKANTTYAIDLFLIFDAPAVGFKAQLVIPSSFAAAASNMGGLIDRNGNATVTIATSTSNTVVQIAVWGTTATNGVMMGRLYIRTGASAGPAVVQFAQNNSTDAANPCSLKAGSTVAIDEMSPLP